MYIKHVEQARQRRNPLFIKSEFSLVRKENKYCKEKKTRRNPLFIKSEFSRNPKGCCYFVKVIHWRGRSQSFIHQVRILSWMSCSGWAIKIRYLSSKSQSFIHQVRILSWKKPELNGKEAELSWSQSFIHQVRILSSKMCLVCSTSAIHKVAILYSSSQNSLWINPGGIREFKFISRNPLFIKSEFSLYPPSFLFGNILDKKESRNPLFIKSEFSHTKEIAWGVLYDESQSFIHQVRILSWRWRGHPCAQACKGLSQSFIHQVRILSLACLDLIRRRPKKSQSFIHQVRILSLKPKLKPIKAVLDGVAILYSSSQNSLPGEAKSLVN